MMSPVSGVMASALSMAGRQLVMHEGRLQTPEEVRALAEKPQERS